MITNEYDAAAMRLLRLHQISLLCDKDGKWYVDPPANSTGRLAWHKMDVRRDEPTDAIYEYAEFLESL